MTKFGLNRQRLWFACHTAFASLMAILIAYAIGLDHPQWSGMTAWAVAQPLRGHLIQKGFFRFLGTVIGSSAGVLMVYFGTEHPWLMVLCLSLWLGVWCAIGNVQRGINSYGSLLAGYSAVMVVALGMNHHQTIETLAFDRMTTVLTGVVVALIIGWFFATREAQAPLLARTYRLTRQCLGLMARKFQGEHDNMGVPVHQILGEISQLEDELTRLEVDALSSRQFVSTARRLLADLVALLTWVRLDRQTPLSLGLAEQLTIAMHTADARALVHALNEATLHADGTQHVETAALVHRLHDVVAALAASKDASPVVNHYETQMHSLVHRDWIGARHAGLRIFIVALVLGVFWQWSGWVGGAFMLLGASVMLSVFSTFDAPVYMMRRHVLWGQVYAVIAALLCRWLVWPYADSVWMQIWMLIPFMLVGIFLYSYPKTMGASMDYNMVSLLLLQTGIPLVGTFEESVSKGGAVILGPIIAWLAYRTLFKVAPDARLRSLMQLMVLELQTMAANTPRDKVRVWHVRLYHRMVKLVAWSQKTHQPDNVVVDGGIGVLRLSRVIVRLHVLLDDPDMPPLMKRRLNNALLRLQRVGTNSAAAKRALVLAAKSLEQTHALDAALLLSGAACLEKYPGFFSYARGGETLRPA